MQALFSFALLLTNAPFKSVYKEGQDVLAPSCRVEFQVILWYFKMPTHMFKNNTTFLNIWLLSELSSGSRRKKTQTLLHLQMIIAITLLYSALRLLCEMIWYYRRCDYSTAHV